ncbi:hypothetical protein ACO1PK_00895 [Alishewanella sp. d11]|uniref:hypothetical protein n=1 Tax=Alishewanella sp. d11 TaxID=3414030 RepID=UPI003BF85D63
MIAHTFIQATQLKAASTVPMVIQTHAEGWQLVNRYNTLTAQQKAALWALADTVIAQRGNLRMHYAVPPMFFENVGVAPKGQGISVACQLKQLKLLACYVGKFSLTVAAINLIESVTNTIAEH